MLLVSIQIDMEDQVALQLQEDLAERIVTTSTHGVIIDISALDIVDSFVGRTLATIASISRVLDAETVVVGMRPAVAITLVELGLSLPGVRTALNVERGMDLIRRATLAERPDGDDDADRKGRHRVLRRRGQGPPADPRACGGGRPQSRRPDEDHHGGERTRAQHAR